MRRLVASLLLVLLIPAYAWAQDASQLFAAGTEAFESGDFMFALSRFEDAADAGMQGPAVHYNIASCHYRLGQFEQAEQAFERVAAGYPEMRTLAEYNLGLVLLKQGREEEAGELFAGVLQDRSSPQLRGLAALALQRIEPQARDAAEGASWMRFVDVNVGHDDNVALIDDASLPANQSVESPFTELIAVFSGPLSPSPGFRFDGIFYSVRYDDADNFDQTVVRAGGAYHSQARAWYFEAGPQLTFSMLDGESFERRLGGRASFRRGLSASAVFGIHVSLEEVQGADTRFEFLEGQRQQLGFTWDNYAAAGRLTLGYEFEGNDRVDPGVSPTRNRLSIRHRYSGARWETDAQVAYRASTYGDLAVTRHEDRMELSLGVARNLRGGWQAKAVYGLFDNDSNVDFYTYTRARVTFGITRTF